MCCCLDLPTAQRPGNLAKQGFLAKDQDRFPSNGNGLETAFAHEIDDAVTWDFVLWLRSISKLPILLKVRVGSTTTSRTTFCTTFCTTPAPPLSTQGILHPEDARMAVPHGVQGIIVSNHGGRQVDGAVTGLDVLPAIVAAVDGRIPVLVDGGIRRGTDVYKALALGASGVLLGRPVLYALALGGEECVRRALDMLHKELSNTMALMGTPRLKDIHAGLLAPVVGGVVRLPQSGLPAAPARQLL